MLPPCGIRCCSRNCRPVQFGTRLLVLLLLALFNVGPNVANDGRPEGVELIAMLSLCVNLGPGFLTTMIFNASDLIYLRSLVYLKRREALLGYEATLSLALQMVARVLPYSCALTVAIAAGARYYMSAAMFFRCLGFLMLANLVPATLLLLGYRAIARQPVGLRRHMSMWTTLNVSVISVITTGFVFGGLTYRYAQMRPLFHAIAALSPGFYSGLGVVSIVLPGLDLPCGIDAAGAKASMERVKSKVAESFVTAADLAEWTKFVGVMDPALDGVAAVCTGDGLLDTIVAPEIRPLMPTGALVILTLAFVVLLLGDLVVNGQLLRALACWAGAHGDRDRTAGSSTSGVELSERRHFRGPGSMSLPERRRGSVVRPDASSPQRLPGAAVAAPGRRTTATSDSGSDWDSYPSDEDAEAMQARLEEYEGLLRLQELEEQQSGC